MKHMDTVLDAHRGGVVKVIGVGGAGGNAVAYLLSRKMAGVDFAIMNRDYESLEQNPCTNKVLLSQLGTLHSADSIVRAVRGPYLRDCPRVAVLIAGMGGNTGTEAAPAIALLCKEIGIFLVCMVITPLPFESEARLAAANEGVAALSKMADMVLELPNEALVKMSSKNASLKDAFGNMNQIMYTGVCIISKMAEQTHRGDIDAKGILQDLKSKDLPFVVHEPIDGESK